MWNEDALILDVDWAPDCVLREVAARLRDRRVRATWFVTHESPAVSELAEDPDLFELGIHPNLLPGSSHGGTPREVLAQCLRWVPGARAMRTHGLVQSTALLDLVIRETPIDVDASLLLPRAAHLEPVEHYWAGRTLCRLPVYWEDDVEMIRPRPCWDLSGLRGEAPGLRIFAFHPIHVALNAGDPGPYEGLKARFPRLSEATPTAVAEAARPGAGPGRLFDALTKALAEAGGGRRLSDLAAAWRAGRVLPEQERVEGNGAAGPRGGNHAIE